MWQSRDRGQWGIGYTSLTQNATLSGVPCTQRGATSRRCHGLAGAIGHVVMCPLKCMCWGHDGGLQGGIASFITKAEIHPCISSVLAWKAGVKNNVVHGPHWRSMCLTYSVALQSPEF